MTFLNREGKIPFKVIVSFVGRKMFKESKEWTVKITFIGILKQHVVEKNKVARSNCSKLSNETENKKKDG